MTTTTSTALDTLSGLTILGRLRQYLAHARAVAAGATPADLPPSLRYDVGLSDMRLDRFGAAGGTGLAPEMMRRGF